MKRELTDISTVKKRLEIEIPQDVVDEEIEKIARKIGRKTRVPGFRPGRAPLGVVKNRFRDDILSETCQHLLPRYFAEAVEEEKLAVVDAPTYDDLDHGPDRPLRFSATFEVFPTLEITNDRGIPVEAAPTEVADEEVEATLERLREEHSEMVPVEEDRPVAQGDFVEITFSGSLVDEEDNPKDQPAGNPLTGEKALCEIGGATTVDEFTENLTGARVGEDRTFEVHYKDDHPDTRLAGKTARYTVRVGALKTKHRPADDDDFASSIGDYKTVAELRAGIREDMESHKKQHARQQIHDSLLEWLGDNNEFEVPDALVQQQLQARLERLMRDLSQRGINPRGLDVDWSKIRQDQYESAIRDVRGSLILEHIADREGFSASDEEVEAEIEKVAAEMQQPPVRVREALAGNGGIDRIRGQIRNSKVLEFLEKQALVQDTGSVSKGSGAE